MSDPSRLSLFRRNNGVYYIIYHRNGRPYWKSTGRTNKAEALKALTQFRHLPKPKLIPKSLSSFVDDILAYGRATFRPGTVEMYRRAFMHLQTLVGPVSLSSLTPQHIDMYKVARLVGHSPVTVNIEVKALKAAMNTAVRWKLLASNPFADVRQLRAPDTLPLFFARDQLDRLLAAVPYVWFKQLIFFAVSTGMRQGEILNLTWQDIDFPRKLIHIQSGQTFTTKAGKRRSIPMNESVTTLLLSKAVKRRNNLVFTYHGRPIAKDYVGHLFKKCVRAAGLDRRLHWHSLRHTHATYLVQAGVPILAVSKLLGHSSVRVTEQHYAALSPENLHAEVNRLGLDVGPLGSVPTPPPSSN